MAAVVTIHPATLRFYLLWAGLEGPDLIEQKRLRPDFAEWLDATQRQEIEQQRGAALPEWTE